VAADVDGRYADEAIALLLREIDATGVKHREFEVKLFGGGNMFPGRSSVENHVGARNVDAARQLVAKHGFNCVAEHLGGHGHRNVILDVWNGNVWVRHTSIARVEAEGMGDDRRQAA